MGRKNRGTNGNAAPPNGGGSAVKRAGGRGRNNGGGAGGGNGGGRRGGNRGGAGNGGGSSRTSGGGGGESDAHHLRDCGSISSASSSASTVEGAVPPVVETSLKSDDHVLETLMESSDGKGYSSSPSPVMVVMLAVLAAAAATMGAVVLRAGAYSDIPLPNVRPSSASFQAFPAFPTGATLPPASPSAGVFAHAAGHEHLHAGYSGNSNVADGAGVIPTHRVTTTDPTILGHNAVIDGLLIEGESPYLASPAEQGATSQFPGHHHQQQRVPGGYGEGTMYLSELLAEIDAALRSVGVGAVASPSMGHGLATANAGGSEAPPLHPVDSSDGFDLANASHEDRYPPVLCSDGYTYGYNDWTALRDAIHEANRISGLRQARAHGLLQGQGRWLGQAPHHSYQVQGQAYQPNGQLYSHHHQGQPMYDGQAQGLAQGPEMGQLSSTYNPQADVYYPPETFTVCPDAHLRPPRRLRSHPIFVDAEDVSIECDGCVLDASGTHLAFGPRARGATIRGMTFTGATASSLTFHHHGAEAVFEDCYWVGNKGAGSSGAVADLNSTSSVSFFRCEMSDSQQAPRIGLGNHPTGVGTGRDGPPVTSSLTIRN